MFYILRTQHSKGSAPGLSPLLLPGTRGITAGRHAVFAPEHARKGKHIRISRLTRRFFLRHAVLRHELRRFCQTAGHDVLLRRKARLLPEEPAKITAVQAQPRGDILYPHRLGIIRFDVVHSLSHIVAAVPLRRAGAARPAPAAPQRAARSQIRPTCIPTGRAYPLRNMSPRRGVSRIFRPPAVCTPVSRGGIFPSRAQHNAKESIPAPPGRRNAPAHTPPLHISSD